MQSINQRKKAKIAEWIPFSLFLLTGTCYLSGYSEIYANIFEKIDFCIKACFVFCIFGLLVADSYDWGLTCKGSLVGLLMFNAINYIDKFCFDNSLDGIYFEWFLKVWVIILGLIFIYEIICFFLKIKT